MKKSYKVLSVVAVIAVYIAGVIEINAYCGDYVVDGMFWTALFTCGYPLIAGYIFGIIHDRLKNRD